MLYTGIDMVPRENLILEQKAFMKGRQRLQIRPDGDLEIYFERLSTRRQFRIPLWQIVSKSERHKFLNSGNLVGTIIFGALTLGTLWGVISCLRSTTDKDVAIVLAFPLLFFGVFAWICFWRLRTQSVDAVVFYNREGGQIHVWFEKPDAGTFYSFCEALSKKAEEAWNHRPLEPAAQSIAGEIAALKKLNSSGVLTDAEFERAKAKLLEQTEQKRIGFA